MKENGFRLVEAKKYDIHIMQSIPLSKIFIVLAVLITIWRIIQAFKKSFGKVENKVKED
jgi:hypothetical protein